MQVCSWHSNTELNRSSILQKLLTINTCADKLMITCKILKNQEELGVVMCAWNPILELKIGGLGHEASWGFLQLKTQKNIVVDLHNSVLVGPLEATEESI